MRKLLPILVLITTASIAGRGPIAAEVRSAGHLLSPSSSDGIATPGGAFRLVGGMGGGGGGMGMGGGGGGMGMGGGGGMGGGPGGMMGGGMSGGGMGAPGGGIPGYGTMPSSGAGLPYGGVDTTDSAAGGQPVQYFQCVTQYGQCSLASSPGAIRSGGACTCTNGHRGKVK
jgi:hypothetical protein